MVDDLRRPRAQRLGEAPVQLLVRPVVVAAHDVGDAELDVVDHAREVIRRGAVGTEQLDAVEALDAEPGGRRAVPVLPLALTDRPFVPADPDPAQVADHGLLAAGHVSRRIRVVDAEEEALAEAAVRDGAQRVSEVERPRGRRREADAGVHPREDNAAVAAASLRRVLAVLTRHAQSTLNLAGRVNGDPTVEAPLTDEGRAQAERLALQLRGLPFDLAVHTRFGRTRDTAEAAVAGRRVRLEVEPLLDDIDVGDLDGASIADYRAWKHAHRRSDRFPGGESLDEAARRYARAFRLLAARPEPHLLVVCHEIPVRYALNGAAGSDDLDAPVHDVPNATPYLFDAAALLRAAARIEELTPPADADGRARA